MFQKYMRNKKICKFIKQVYDNIVGRKLWLFYTVFFIDNEYNIFLYVHY